MSRKIVLLLQHICKHINLIIILLLMLFFFECDIHVKIDSGICFLSHSSWLCALIQQQWLNIQFWLKIVSVPTIKSLPNHVKVMVYFSEWPVLCGYFHLGCKRSRSCFTKHGKRTKSKSASQTQNFKHLFSFNPSCREIPHRLCFGYLKYLQQKRQRWKCHCYFKYTCLKDDVHFSVAVTTDTKIQHSCHGSHSQSLLLKMYLFILLGTNYQ